MGRMVEIMIDRETVVNELRSKEMVVHFTKKNGEQRIMTCTLSPNFIPKDNLPKGTSTKEPKPLAEQTVCSVYDVEANGWRSFLWENVIEVKDIDTAMAQTLDNLKQGTSRLYRIRLWGYGGELVYSQITKAQFDYWYDKKEEELTDYILEDDAETVDVPAEADFAFEDGYRRPWYELDNIEHDNGVSADNANISIEEVEDDSWSAKTVREIYEGTLNDFVNDAQSGDMVVPSITPNKLTWEQRDLEEQVADREDFDGYVFYGMSIEKGNFFDGLVRVNGEFDIHKLTFTATEYPNGDNIVSSITYGEEDIDNEGGDTNGKGYAFGVYEW